MITRQDTQMITHPMSNPTPDVRSPFGAPFGRIHGRVSLPTKGERLTLKRIRINRQGYDPGGAYWGVGLRLYAWTAGDGNWSYLRARDRESAKAQIREWQPGAEFYR